MPERRDGRREALSCDRDCARGPRGALSPVCAQFRAVLARRSGCSFPSTAPWGRRNGPTLGNVRADHHAGSPAARGPAHLRHRGVDPLAQDRIGLSRPPGRTHAVLRHGARSRRSGGRRSTPGVRRATASMVFAAFFRGLPTRECAAGTAGVPPALHGNASASCVIQCGRDAPRSQGDRLARREWRALLRLDEASLHIHIANEHIHIAQRAIFEEDHAMSISASEADRKVHASHRGSGGETPPCFRIRQYGRFRSFPPVGRLPQRSSRGLPAPGFPWQPASGHRDHHVCAGRDG